MEDTQEQQSKQNYDWLKQYQFQKGKSGNPGGAPKGKRLKTFALELIANMNDEDKASFLKKIDPRIVWEMAEGKAKQDIDTEVKATINIVVPKAVAESFNIQPSESNTETGGDDTE